MRPEVDGIDSVGGAATMLDGTNGQMRRAITLTRTGRAVTAAATGHANAPTTARQTGNRAEAVHRYRTRESDRPMVRLLELPADQRPTNRLLRLGASALTDAELVAILLTTGTHNQDVLTLAQQLLHRVGGVAGLAQCHPEHLIKIHGLGPTKTARLLTALALPTRAHTTHTVTVRCPDDLVPVLRPMFSLLRHERFAVAICDRQARVRTVRTITDGGSDGAPLMIRDTLATVLRHDGHAFAIAHDHPSGDPTPSTNDRQATARIRRAAEVAGLTFLCHLILGAGDTWATA